MILLEKAMVAKIKHVTEVLVVVQVLTVRSAKVLEDIEADITLAVAEEATMEALQDREDHLELILPLQVLLKPLDEILATVKQQ